MYASLLMSLLAAFIAMLGKQWLNRYLRHSGGSMIERCGDRQRKCDGLKRWPLHFFIEGLPVMLQAALLFLACGLCRYTWSINAPVAYTLICLTALGVVFFVAIVIAGMSSYACPFQTPVSTALRGAPKRVQRGFQRALSRIRKSWNRRVRPLLRRPSLSTRTSLSSIEIQETKLWLEPKDLAIIHTTNVNDARCVSWIIRNITDPEAVDAAVRLAGAIRWFDGPDVDVPYDSIVSMFEACFDPSGRLYPGSRDRAYYSVRAIVWIRGLAACKFEGFAYRFPLSYTHRQGTGLDYDLMHLLRANQPPWFGDLNIARLFKIEPEHTPSHAQWVSDAVLHYCWASRSDLDYEGVPSWSPNVRETKAVIPLNATLNRLLVWCIFFGSPPVEEALMVQKKSYDTSCFALQITHAPFTSDCLEQILNQFSKAILLAVNGNRTSLRLVPHALRDLVKLEARPSCLTELVYEWCSAIYANRAKFEDWENLLLICLELGFRHFDLRQLRTPIRLTHTEHHQGLVDAVFKSRKSEAVADLLHAWTMEYDLPKPAGDMVGICTGQLINLHNSVPFSPRLRRLVIRFIGVAYYRRFEGAGVEKLVELLDHLHVTVEEMTFKVGWASLLLGVIRSSEGTQLLSDWYWGLLAELAVLVWRWLGSEVIPGLRIAKSLIEAEEWVKLESWIGIVWVHSGSAGIMEEGLDHPTLLLFRQRPGAARRLEQWMERWSQRFRKDVPESLRRILTQAHEAVQQQVAL